MVDGFGDSFDRFLETEPGQLMLASLEPTGQQMTDYLILGFVVACLMGAAFSAGIAVYRLTYRRISEGTTQTGHR
jgi:predicted PurR-regulated permease PerM